MTGAGQWRAALALAATLALAGAPGCGSPEAALRVGAKSFAEQQILAEVLSQLLRQHGRAGAAIVHCGDTYGCHRALQRGGIDLMVEYSGTGLAFLGQPPASEGSSLPKVRALFKPLRLRWLGGLGFDNGYRLLMPTDRAAALGVRGIADLDKIEGGVRIACPAEYLRRPLDGLAALLQRYGLRRAGEPLVIDDPGKRYHALVAGRADVAVGYASDGAIRNLGLRELDDSLDFFPPYEAAVVVREPAIERDPGLVKVLGRLEGRLGLSAMRRLNYEVQVEGRQPAMVARRYLHAARLVKARTPDKVGPRRPEMVLAVHKLDAVDSLVMRATQVVRRVFPDHAVVVSGSADPAGSIQRGKARLALLGAERFFIREGNGPPRRDGRSEALAVMATRVVHLVRRRDEQPDTDPLAGRVGVGERGSGRARITEAILGLSGGKPAAHAAPKRLLGQVAAGKLDGALVLAPVGDPDLARLLGRRDLVLRPLTHGEVATSGRGWLDPERAVQLPYLRPARIPAGTYAGIDRPVDTVGAQVLLAGPSSRGSSHVLGGGGPAAALPTTARPFTRAQVEALVNATDVAAAPDPILPSAWALGADTAEGPLADEGEGSVFDTLMNVLALVFLVWLALLALRPDPSAKAR